MKKCTLYQAVCTFIILAIAFSCVSENQEIVRDKSGNVCLKCELKNSIRNGKCYEYYPNGAIKNISNWIAGIQNGQRIDYFENGDIKETSMWKDGKAEGECLEYSTGGYIHKIMQFKDGKPFGLWTQYYQGIPMHSIQYLIVQDEKQYVNQIWVYDYFGNIEKEGSHYYTIYSEKGDSVKVGEPGEIKVKLEAPMFGGYMKLVVGDFDNKFYPKDSTKLDTIRCIGFEGTVKYKFDKKGTQFIQGIILDGKKEKGYDEKGKYTETNQREIYFVKAFEVF